jgi:hypothetical protein
LQQQAAALAAQNKAAAAKKPAPVGVKPGGNVADKNAVVAEESNKKSEREVESNQIQILPATVKSPIGADLSAPLKPPSFYPRLFFYQSEVILANELRTFSAYSSYMITTGIYAVWVGNKFLEYHALLPISSDNIPIWMVFFFVKM